PCSRPRPSGAPRGLPHADSAVRLTAIAQQHSSVTARQARIALSNLFRWAIGEGWISGNPVTATNVPKGARERDRVLTDAELAAIYRACGGDDFGRRGRVPLVLP